MGDFAPKLVGLTDDVLFGDVWQRGGLSPRDRSLITVAALVAGGSAEQPPNHLTLGKQNGLTAAELIEAITPRLLHRMAQGHVCHELGKEGLR